MQVALGWTNALHESSRAERWVLHDEHMRRPSGPDVRMSAELAWSSIGPLASRLVRRGFRDPSAVLADVLAEKSLFEFDDVRELFSRDGFIEYKRHVESIELLGGLLVRALELVIREATNSGETPQ